MRGPNESRLRPRAKSTHVSPPLGDVATLDIACACEREHRRRRARRIRCFLLCMLQSKVEGGVPNVPETSKCPHLPPPPCRVRRLTSARAPLLALVLQPTPRVNDAHPCLFSRCALLVCCLSFTRTRGGSERLVALRAPRRAARGVFCLATASTLSLFTQVRCARARSRRAPGDAT